VNVIKSYLFHQLLHMNLLAQFIERSYKVITLVTVFISKFL